MSGNLYGELFQNVVHVEVVNDGMSTLEVAAEMRTNFIGDASLKGIHQMTTAAVMWTSVTAQMIVPVVGLHETLFFAQPGVQASSTEHYMQLCYLLRFQTNLSGRKGKGRIYVPGVMAGFTTNGRIDDTFHQFNDSALQGLRERFIKDNGIGVGPCTLAVASRTNPSQYASVFSIQVADKIATQRRRNFV